MKIYTRKGDDGTTSLIGGSRVAKNHLRLEAYGTLDELMAHVGCLYDILPPNHFTQEELAWVLLRIMDCSAFLATEDTSLQKLPSIDIRTVERLEQWTDNHLEGLPVLRKFTLPVGHPTISQSNVCRTVCRRAERRIISLQESGVEFPAIITTFINRLSDYLYSLGRRLASENGVDEQTW